MSTCAVLFYIVLLFSLQMSPVFVDLPALAQTLQQVPLHQRLHLEAELLQVLIQHIELHLHRPQPICVM